LIHARQRIWINYDKQKIAEMKGDTYLSVNDSQRFKRCQTKYKYKGGMSKK